MPNADFVRFIAARAYEQYSYIAAELYNDRQLQPAIVQYRKARDAALRCSHQKGAQHCSCMIGACLYQLGRFREALTELSPFLDLLVKETAPWLRYNALIQYIEAAQKLPVALVTIDRAYAEAEQLLKTTHNTAWRHELLVHRARLELARGNTDAALSTAMESIALKRAPNEGGYCGQVWDYHYDGLVDIALASGKPEAAENYVNQWARHEDQMPANRHIRRARCLADLRCFQGRYAEAARWAEIAFEAALATDYMEVRTAAFRSFIRVRLAVGDLNAAREGLVKYAQTLRGESAIERYAFYVTLGSYYEARANIIGSSSPGQEQSTKGAQPTSKAPPKVQFTLVALRAYRKAQKAADKVDGKLKCNLRIREVTVRISDCESILPKKMIQGA